MEADSSAHSGTFGSHFGAIVWRPRMSALAASLADALEGDRRNTLRASQRAPAGDWTFWLLLAGRGFGKGFAGASWVLDAVDSGEARHIALIAPTAADARDTMLEGPSGILTLSPDYNRPVYEPSKRRVTWQNGATATLFTSEEPNRLRGPNHDLAWLDELCAWQNMQETFDMAMLTLRMGKQPRVCITTTPRPSKLLKDLISRDGRDVRVVRGSTFENEKNLAPSFLAQITSRYGGTRLGRQELNAEVLEDVPGALWTIDMLEEARIAPNLVPAFKRCVVAIDPAVSTGENSDETGIVVAGVAENGLAYVVEDASGRYQPADWARKAISLYRKWSADRIIGEINQGGQLIETTLRAVDGNIPFRGVHAKRGKIVRAEPVSALYEQGKVKHAGVFSELEDQLCTYAGGSDSPDRLDALVYALSDLMLGYQVQPSPIVVPFVHSVPRPEMMRETPMPSFDNNRSRYF
jgi:predicted phage terminase large subunit-like protein